METELPSQMTGVCLFAAIVENMAEFRPEMCTEAAQQGLLQWLLKRLKVNLCCVHGSCWVIGTGCYSCAVWSVGNLLAGVASFFASLLPFVLKIAFNSPQNNINILSTQIHVVQKVYTGNRSSPLLIPSSSTSQRQPLLTIFYLSFQKLSVKIGVYVCVYVFHK